MEKVRTVYLKTSVEDPDIADCGFGSLYTDWECLIYASGWRICITQTIHILNLFVQ